MCVSEVGDLAVRVVGQARPGLAITEHVFPANSNTPCTIQMIQTSETVRKHLLVVLEGVMDEAEMIENKITAQDFSSIARSARLRQVIYLSLIR